MAKWSADMMKYQIDDWTNRRVGFNIGFTVGIISKLLARVTVTLAALKYLFEV